MVLDFPVLADYAVLYAGGRMIFATHGHLHGEKNPPKLHGDDVLLCGHTHVPAYTQYENYLYINPGSVSIPKEGSAHAYMGSPTRRSFIKRWTGKCTAGKPFDRGKNLEKPIV